MAKFTDASNTAISALNLVVGPKHVRFDEGQKATSITVKSSDSSVKVVGTVVFDGPEGIHTVKLSAAKAGSAIITGTTRSGQSATLSITVGPRIELPPRNTTAGLVARLLLAEVMSPSGTKYNLTDATTCMERMVLVLNNRLKNPGQFGATGATTVDEIIKAPGQFAGFDHFPNHYAPLIPRIQGVVDNANNNNLPSQSDFQNHLNEAIRIANAHATPITDPSSTELIGWRTSGHGSPGPSFVAFSVQLLGTQFFQRK